MLGKKKFEPKLMYNLTIDDLVPEDNFYRILDDLLDLRFVYQHCKSLYATTGNPSIDPVVFFKLNLFGFFENITSDMELIRRAGDTISVRYYLGYDIDEKLPWHSTISRTRAIIKKETFEIVFNKIVEKCYQAGLIGGRHQSIDSTLVNANASLDSLERRFPKLRVKEFVDKSYQENTMHITEKDKEGKDNDKFDEPDQELKNKDLKSDKPDRSEKNRCYYSKTDPDSRIKSKPGKLSRLYYSTHYSADSKNKIITDVLTTYADRNDSTVLLEVYQRAEKRLKKLGLSIAEISADKGYCSGKNLREMDNRGIEAFIPTQKYKNTTGNISSEEFSYNAEENLYICPNNKKLDYHTYEKGKQRHRYLARKEDCSNCPLKINCCPDTERRSISRTIYYEEYQRLSRRLKTPEARRAYIIRKTVSEGLFAEAKMNHGLNKFMTRGIDKAQKNSYMIASVQNLKRLVKDIRRRAKKVVQINMGSHNEKLFNVWEVLFFFNYELSIDN